MEGPDADSGKVSASLSAVRAGTGRRYDPTVELHLLDGTYELFRAYFGAPTRTAPDGTEIGAVHGIMASALRLIEEHSVTHLAAAFDTVIRSFRNDIYSGYKTEAGVPQELLDQFPLAEEGMKTLGVRVFSMIEYEADDAIATAAHVFADDFDQIVMMSPDKDLAQCIRGTHTIGYDRRKREAIDADGVVAKFGVRPESIPDYLGLVGDSADGLPGVKGWGAKSASVMLSHYRHIEEIPVDPELWEPPVRGKERLAQSLTGSMAEALLWRYLATLRRDVPLGTTVDDLAWEGVDREAFEAFCDRWGFGALSDRAPRYSS